MEEKNLETLLEDLEQKTEEPQKGKKRRQRKAKKEKANECQFMAENILNTLEAIKLQTKQDNLNPLYKNVWLNSFLQTCEKYNVAEKVNEKPEILLMIATALLLYDATNDKMRITFWDKLKFGAKKLLGTVKNVFKRGK